MTTYTMSEARASLGEVVRKARYGRREVVELTEHGRPAAVVIRLEMLAYYQGLEDAQDLAEAERITAEGRPTVPHEEVAAPSRPVGVADKRVPGRQMVHGPCQSRRIRLRGVAVNSGGSWSPA
jgi:prevent-host-death family protein